MSFFLLVIYTKKKYKAYLSNYNYKFGKWLSICG